MNDGMFIALRAEAQEQNSLLKQILDEQRRTNEMLSQLAYPNIKSGATGGTPNTAMPLTIEAVKAEPLKTTETATAKQSWPPLKKGK